MSNAVTGSVALTELKNDLTRLSDTLHTIYDLMSADMTQVGQAWQDGKYQEFVDGYKPQINKCEEISERYKEWCLRVLDPTIENVIAVEKTDVGSSSGSATGTAVGGAGVATAGVGRARQFNMNGSDTSSGDGKKIVSRPQTGAKKTSSKPFQAQTTPKNANEACKADFGEKYKAVPTSANDPDAGSLYVKSTKKGSDWSAGGKLGVGVGAGPVHVEVGGDGRYNSGSEDVESVRNVPSYKCVPETE